MSYFGITDTSKILIDGSNPENLNWTEITVPEILTIPIEKPNIESINQVYAEVNITSVKLIETPFAYETTCLCTVATPEQIAAGNAIVALVNALNLPGLAATVITPVQNLLNTLDALNLPIIDALIAPVQATLDLVSTTITAVTTLLAQIVTALADPTTTICTLTSLFNALNTLLTTLLTAVQTLLQQLEDLLQELLALVGSIPLLAPIILVLQTLLGTITPILQALISDIGEILLAITGLLETLCPNCLRLIPNEEGTFLTGRKLIVEGTINQKVVYTALVAEQSVHSAHFCIPFSAFIIAYAKFVDMPYDPETGCFDYTPGQPIVVDLNEDFNVVPYIEDIIAYALDERTIFKNVTLFLKAKPVV